MRQPASRSLTKIAVMLSLSVWTTGCRYGTQCCIEQRVRERTAELDRINRAMQGSSDVEQMLSDVLDAVLSIFACDRAWLVTPGDPEASSYRVPMERTRPEYPGALARGLEVPVDPETARVLRALRDSSGPVTFGPGLQQPLPTALSERFRVRSQIAVAVYPRASLPCVLVLSLSNIIKGCPLNCPAIMNYLQSEDVS